MSLSDAYNDALEKGWWDPYLPGGDRTRAPVIPPDATAAKLMLIVTEVAEACECVRTNDVYEREENGKPCGLPSELADIAIRLWDLAGALGIDLTAAAEAKMRFNRSREYRHGGKAL